MTFPAPCFRHLCVALGLLWAQALPAIQPEDEDFSKLRTELIRYKEGWFTKACPGDLLVHVKSPRLRVTQTLSLEVQIFNVCQGCRHEIPAGSKIVVRDWHLDPRPAYFVHAAVPLPDKLGCEGGDAGSATVAVELKAKISSSSITSLPAKLHLVLLDGRGQETPWGSALIDFPFHVYRPAFDTAKHRYNILAVGFPGAGKTTYILSLSSALSPRSDQQLPSDIGRSKGHNTKSINKYDFAAVTQDSSLGINLWDTWGICEGSTCQYKDFSESFLENLADGVVPHGYHLLQFDAQKGELRNSSSQAFSKADRMHAIIFVMRFEHAFREPEKTLAKKYVAKIEELGYTTQVVVTWMHRACGRNNTQACQDARVKEVAKTLDVEQTSVFPFTRGEVNLEGYKDSLVGSAALGILETSMRNANDRFSKEMELAHQKAMEEEAEQALKAAAEQKQKAATEKALQDARSALEAASGNIKSIFSSFELPSEMPNPKSAAVLLALLSLGLFVLCCTPIVRSAAVPEWRRREVRIDPWLKLLLGILVLASWFCSSQAGLKSRIFPLQWGVTNERDCSQSHSSVIGKRFAVRSEDECTAACEASQSCLFASHKKAGCSLYSRCEKTTVDKASKLLTKLPSVSWELVPQAALNTVALLFQKLTGLLLVLTILVSLGIDTRAAEMPEDLLLKVVVFQALSAGVQLIMHLQFKERVRRILDEEKRKAPRRKEIESELWNEAKGRGNTAKWRSRQTSIADLSIGLAIMAFIGCLVVHVAYEVSGVTSTVGRWNLVNVLFQSLVGIDSNSILKAFAYTVGVFLASKPFIVGIKKFEHGALGFAFDPMDDITNAMESIATQAWEIERLIDQELQAARSASDNEGESSQICRYAPENVNVVKAKVLAMARQQVLQYASQLQADPRAVFDRDDLLSDLAKATEEAGGTVGGVMGNVTKNVAMAVSGGWMGAAVRACTSRSGSSGGPLQEESASGANALVAASTNGDGKRQSSSRKRVHRKAEPDE